MEKQEKGQFNEQISERTISIALGIHQLMVNIKVSPMAAWNYHKFFLQD
jgi:hypothetical protein